MSSPVEVLDIGTLHWIADDPGELQEWRRAFLWRCQEIRAVPNGVGKQIDVSFALPKARAREILGYQPAEEEWA